MSFRRAFPLCVLSTALVVSALVAQSAGATTKGVSAGYNFACAIDDEGRARCWGNQSEVTAANSPTLSSLTWATLSSGYRHACGVTTSGDANCWGVADGTQLNVPAGAKWKQISAGYRHSCGITTSDDAICWGSAAAAAALIVPAGQKWQLVRAGNNESCGVTTFGQLLCWGANGFQEESYPTGKSWLDVSMSTGPTGQGRTCGLAVDQQVSCWGNRLTAWNYSAASVVPPAGNYFTFLGNIGEDATCLVRTTGFLACFGYYLDGSFNSGDVKASDVSVGSGFACSISATDSRLSCWNAGEPGWYCCTRAADKSIPYPDPPALSLDTSGVTSRTSAQASFSGRADAVFECRLDNGAWDPCAASASFTGLGDGAHTFAVRQWSPTTYDDSLPATVSWTVDTTPPSLPTFSAKPLAITNNRTGAFTVSAEASSSLSCSLDDAAFTRCPSPISYASLTEGSHTLRVKATDTVGNVGDSAAYTWAVDLTAPVAPSATPSLPIVNVRTNSVNFSGEEGATFQCSYDGGAFSACTSPKSFSAMPDGSHSLAVKQTDVAGNVSSAGTANWTVDTAAPGAPVMVTPSSPTKQRDGSFGFVGSEGGGTYLCSLDSATPASCTSPYVVTGAGDGSHTLSVRHRDAAGNTSAARTVNWTVDTTAPEAPVIGQPQTPSKDQAPRISFEGEPGATFQCSVDGQDYAGCSSPKSFAALTAGAHTLAVRQSDLAGNISETASVSWTVDLTKPVAPTINVPASPSASRSATVTLVGEVGATFRCSVDGAAYSSCPATLNLSSLIDGGHSVTAMQTDAAGNESVAATSEWLVDSTNPVDPVIQGAPAALTSSARASIAFTSEGGATFTCAVDGGGFSICSSPITLTGLVDGAHSLIVKAHDAAGNESGESTALWTVDRTAPAPPEFTSKPDSFTRNTSATLRFTGEVGGTFSCQIDSGLYAPCASPKSMASLADGPHSLTVKVTDAAGNASAPATAGWVVDTTAPSAPKVTTVGSLIGTKNVTFSFTGEVGASFTCNLDGTGFTACVSPRFISGLADGAHTFAVKQTDRAGNESAATSSNWSLDSTAPAAPNLTGAPAAVTKAATANFGFASESGATFQCSVDDGPYAACTSPRALAGLADGEHSFSVRAKDSSGNIGSESTATWVVDRVAPDAPTVLSGPAAFVPVTTAEIAFDAESEAKVECSVDKKAFAVCASPLTLTGLKDGVHTVAIRQTDKAGNLGLTGTVTWTVDTVAPSAPKITGPSALTNSTSATLNFAGEAGATFTCSVDGGEWGSCDATTVRNSLSAGSHLVSARQADRAGNSSATATLAWQIDTTAPALSGQVRVKQAGANVVVTSAFDAGLGRPDTLEFSTAKVAPSAGVAPVAAKTAKYGSPLTVKSSTLITFVRVRDLAGNWSQWYAAVK